MPAPTSHARPLIAIVGGAVAGSEAARMAAERGARVVVFEANDRPYGKIEDGLPRWHASLREKEFARIDANLDHPAISLVPSTAIGRDLTWGELVDGLGFTAVILANGAWRDRRLPVDGIEAFLGRGFHYQNSFVMAFNRHDDAHLPVLDGGLVIGGGLASIDVCKILSFRAWSAAFAARGQKLDAEAFDKRGLAALCETAGINPAEIGLRGPTLFYRRRAEDMPLVSAEDGDSSRAAKLAQTRLRILEKAMEKYGFRFEPLASPVATLTDGHGALAGLRFQRNAVTEDGRVRPVPGDLFDVAGPLVVASIGSIPAPIPGVPMDGELYRWQDPDRGELAREGGPATAGARLFGLGNVLTGKGNIVESRRNARKIMAIVSAEVLGEAGAEDASPGASGIAPVVAGALAAGAASPDREAGVEAGVRARHAALGYTAWPAWLAAHPVPAEA